MPLFRCKIQTRVFFEDRGGYEFQDAIEFRIWT